MLLGEPIFKDDQDRQRFLETKRRVQAETVELTTSPDLGSIISGALDTPLVSLCNLPPEAGPGAKGELALRCAMIFGRCIKT
jgi:hypothetical protein